MPHHVSTLFVGVVLATGCADSGGAKLPLVVATPPSCPTAAAPEPAGRTSSWNWEPVNSPSLAVPSGR